ncbi:MAG: hypothetical protein JXR70_07420, partial [Spirochaetales bacterium]|nr:hypothetical protein [Spirochaetales bacterium]
MGSMRKIFTITTLILMVFSASIVEGQSADVFIDDFDGWDDTASTGGTYSRQNTTAVSEYAMSLDFDAGGIYRIDSIAGTLALANYDYLTFYVNGGSTGGQNFQIQLLVGGTPQTTVQLTSYLGSGAPVSSFSVVSIPLADLGITNQYIDGIVFSSASVLQPLYIDEIAFIRAPAVVYMKTMDVDLNSTDMTNSYGNGRIETIEITFNHAIIDPANGSGGFTVDSLTGVQVKTNYALDTANDNKLYLTFTEDPAYMTDATPSVSYNYAANNISDMYGIPVASFGPIVTLDGAKPSLMSATSTIGSRHVAVTFSEPVYSTAGPIVSNLFKIENDQFKLSPYECLDADGSDEMLILSAGINWWDQEIFINSSHISIGTLIVETERICDLAGNLASKNRILSPITDIAYNTFFMDYAKTMDTNSNGFIDAIEIVFSTALNDSTMNINDFRVSGANITGYDSTLNGSTVNDNKIYLIIQDNMLNGGLTPFVVYTPGNLKDGSNNSLPSSSIASLDYVVPVFLGAFSIVGSNKLVLLFSEAVTPNSGMMVPFSDFGTFHYQNNNSAGVSGLSSFIDSDGSNGNLIFQTNTTYIAGDFSSDTIYVDANIYDMAFNKTVPGNIITVYPADAGSGVNGETKIVGVYLSTTNSYIDIYFNAGVYNTTGGSGAIDIGDLNVTFNQNGGTATGITVDSIITLNNQALAGGESSVRLLISVTGSPSGVEYLSVAPVGSTMYNYFGYAVSTTSVNSNAFTATATGNSPTIVSIKTDDADKNGKIDYLILQFDSEVEVFDPSKESDGFPGLTVNGYTLANNDNRQAIGSTIRIKLNEAATINTSTTPLVSFDNSFNTIKAIGDGVNAASFTNITALDGIGPLILSARTLSSTAIELNFTEPVKDSTLDAGDFYISGFSAGNGNPALIVTGNYADDDTIILNLSAAILPGNDGSVVYTGSDKVQDMSISANGNAKGSLVTVTNNLSFSGPSLLSTTTGDNDNDGFIDRLVLLFNEPVNVSDGSLADALPGLSLSSGVIRTDVDYASSSSASVVIELEQPNSGGTGETPDVTYSNIYNNIVSASSGIRAQSFIGETSIDGAGPVILSARTIDTTHIEITLSETILNSQFQTGDFTLNGLSGGVISDFNDDTPTNDDTLLITITPAFLLSDTGDINFSSAGAVLDSAGNGNVGSLPAVTIEGGIMPLIQEVRTADLNSDGYLDAVRVQFSKPMDDSTLNPAGFTIGGTAATGINDLSGTEAVDNNILYLNFDYTAFYFDTGAVPKLSYVAATGGFLDMSAYALADVIDLDSVDGAAPRIVSAQTLTETTVEVTFSEAVNDDLPITGSEFFFSTFSGISDSAGTNFASGSGASDNVVIISLSGSVGIDETGLVALTGAGVIEDMAGNGNSHTATVLVSDGIVAVPLITAYVTRDTNNDGHLDALEVNFDGNVNVIDGNGGDGFADLDVGGGSYSIAFGDYETGHQNVSTLTFTLTPLVAYDTGATPSVTYANNGNIVAAGSLVPVSSNTATAVDGAAPVLIGVTTSDGISGGNILSGSELELTFSEDINITTITA